MAGLNLSTFKYPIGFIKLVEFLFTVIAIAAVNSWGGEVNYSCPPNSTTTKSFSTFSLSDVDFKCDDKSSHVWTSENNSGGSAGFFYFVNVAGLIYTLVAMFVYVILWQLYQNEKRIALGDLAITALLFLLFFLCSSIWWAGANNIGRATSDETLGELFNKSSATLGGAKYISRSVNNGKLAISVLSDWVCVLCFALNCWFIWKEIVPRSQENPTSIA